MNPHILMVIDNQINPDKYTLDELKANAEAADANANTDTAYVEAYAACAACADTYAAAADADYWLNEYFNYSGENKQDYIDAINKLTTK